MKNTILRSARLAAAIFAALLAFSVFTGCPDLNGGGGGGGGNPAQEAADGFKNANAGVLAKTADTVTADDEAAVDAALAAYEKLDADAKALVADQKAALDNLKSKISAPKDAAAFNSAHGDVLGKTADTVTAADAAKVDAALAAYNTLSSYAKALVVEEKTLLDALKAKVDALAAQEAAAAFKNTHAGILAKTVDNVKAADAVKVDAALTAYNALGKDVKDLLGAEKTKLDALKAEIAGLGASEAEKEAAQAFKNEATTVLEKAVDDVTPADKEAIEAALAEYDALGETEKALLAVEKAHLDDLKAKIDELTGGPNENPNEDPKDPSNPSKVPVKAGVTLVDPFTEPASLAAFTLKRAAGDANERHKLTLDAAGVAQITWYVDTVSRGSSAELTLSAWDYTPGKHYVSVEFSIDGKRYDANLVFTVEAAGSAGGGA